MLRSGVKPEYFRSVFRFKAKVGNPKKKKKRGRKRTTLCNAFISAYLGKQHHVRLSQCQHKRRVVEHTAASEQLVSMPLASCTIYKGTGRCLHERIYRFRFPLVRLFGAYAFVCANLTQRKQIVPDSNSRMTMIGLP